jgi:hypothetical protein
MKSSSLCKFSLISYIPAYELEYSLIHVMVMIYELDYSLYTMILIWLLLFFMVHMIYEFRDRVGSGIMVCCAFRIALVLARQSVGLESWGDMSRDLVCGHGARIHGNLRI